MADKKRILIFSASYGGGHHRVAEAMKGYYGSHHFDDVEVDVVDFFEEFAPSLNVLARFAYQQSSEFFPVGFGSFEQLTSDVPSNPVVHELKQLGLGTVRTRLDEYGPDAVISTFPVPGGVVADIAGDMPLVSVNLSADFDAHHGWVHPATDIHFVTCKEAREDLVVRGVPWDRVVVSGIPIDEGYAVKTDRAQCRKELGLSDRFTVLLRDIAGLPGDVRDIVRQLVGMGVQVAAVAEDDSRLMRRLTSVEGESGLLKLFSGADEIFGVMKAADLAIGSAGAMTIAESLATRSPSVICGAVPGQEVHNVDFLTNYGAILLARDEDDIVEKVRFLSSHPDRLEQMSKNAGSLGQLGAARQLCERVLAAIR